MSCQTLRTLIEVASSRSVMKSMSRNMASSQMATHKIVPPEPHSVELDLRKASSYVPRWLQVVLFLILAAVVVLIVIFVKE